MAIASHLTKFVQQKRLKRERNNKMFSNTLFFFLLSSYLSLSFSVTLFFCLSPTPRCSFFLTLSCTFFLPLSRFRSRSLSLSLSLSLSFTHSFYFLLSNTQRFYLSYTLSLYHSIPASLLLYLFLSIYFSLTVSLYLFLSFFLSLLTLANQSRHRSNKKKRQG